MLTALVLLAVKTKRRLQTHPNILLACLALTDLMAGHVTHGGGDGGGGVGVGGKLSGSVSNPF